MEKLEKSSISSGQELEMLLGQALGEIRAMVKKEDLIISDPNILDSYIKFDYKPYINGNSKKSLKKLNRFLRYWSETQSISNANKLFHYLQTRFAANRKEVEAGSKYYSWTFTVWEKTLEPIKISASKKELLIQEKRMLWKKLRDESEKALFEYKKEKGDFYKNKIKQKAELDLELV